MELLVALVLVSLIILYFSAIERIGYQDLLTTGRRTKVQNDVSRVLDHISTNITGRKRWNSVTLQMDTYGGAIGNTQISSEYPINTTSGIGGDNAIIIWIDYTNNGQRDSSDKQIAYRYSPAPNYQIWYYPSYTGYTGSLSSCTCPNPTDLTSCCEVITGNRIMPDFRSADTNAQTYVYYPSSGATINYLDVQITGCWNPAGTPYACGTPNNPSVVMHAYINMPSVSTN
jgi:hypothetical protein